MPDLKAHERSDIDKEACAWIAQFDGAEPSAADLEAFREWVNRSPRHREAVERLSDLWSELNILTELAVPPRPRRQSWPLPLPGLAAAFSLVLAVALVFLLGRTIISPTPVTYATAVGEQRTESLADGSQVELNTGSRLRVAYTDEARELYLLQGEAFFDVAHDRERPFVVHVGGRTVRAVGTAFSVRRETGAIEVLVVDGVVELGDTSGIADSANKGVKASPGRRGKVLGIVKRGQRTRLAETLEAVEPVSDEEVARELAWRQGMLSFAGEPLAVVVEEIGRYTDTHIVIEDPALRSLRIGGYFRAGDTDAMLHTLEAGFPIDVDRVDEQTVRLRARQ